MVCGRSISTEEREGEGVEMEGGHCQTLTGGVRVARKTQIYIAAWYSRGEADDEAP